MPKIDTEEKFIDFSDYGRAPAIFFSTLIKSTGITPIHVTFGFGIIGLLSAYSILMEYYVLAGLGLILKSIIDAMDGELARIKESPSYTGRYLDSIFDSLLNLLFIMVISYKSASPYWLAFIAFLCIQLQGTLYNYYYVILRHRSVGGDKTSKIFEKSPPTAFPNERQSSVNNLFRLFKILYLPFDWMMYFLDPGAYKVRHFPSWFMSMISIYGLGFQLMLIAIIISSGWIDYTIPFFIGYTVLIGIFVTIRRIVIR